LEGIHVAGENEEDRHPREAFDVNANEWPVVPRDAAMIFNSGPEKPTSVTANEMGCDHEYGSNTSKALYVPRQSHEEVGRLGVEYILRPIWYLVEV
jgi:hypothetical protein